MVSRPSSNYLVKFLVMKERLHRVAYKDQKRATLKAVTSPEDRLGENRLPSARDDVTDSKLKTSLNNYGDNGDMAGDLELAPLL